MTTLFSDSFTRANSGTIDATNWVETAGGNWDIVSNALASGGNGTLITTTSAHAAVADCKATAKVTSAPAGFDGGPMVRATTNGQGGYFLDVIRASGSMSVWRRVSNADTQVGADITGLTIANGDTYTLEVSGSGATVTLKAYQNGVQKGSNFSDTSGSRITAAGQSGIIDFTSASVTWDDFLVEDLAAGGTTGTALPGVGAVSISGLAPTANAFTKVAIKEVLINEAGSPVSNKTGMTLMVWYQGFPGGAPDLSYSALTTDAAGTASWSLVPGTLAFGQNIFYVATDGGTSLSMFTCGRLVPTYS